MTSHETRVRVAHEQVEHLVNTYKNYTEEQLTDVTWDVISVGLRLLSLHRPSGDDDVFDYWPNGLQAMSALYDLWANNLVMTPGSGKDWTPFYDYWVHHFDESVGWDQTCRLLAILCVLEVPVLVYDKDELSSYQPPSLKTREE